MIKEDIRSYAELMREFHLTSLEITENNQALRLERRASGPVRGIEVQASSSAPLLPADDQLDNEPADHRLDNEPAAHSSVKSPVVGIFYAAPAENAAPYVTLGERVAKGQTLCIVEAMKLMNEITAEEDGIISEICASNGQVVEYGTELFRIRR